MQTSISPPAETGGKGAANRQLPNRETNDAFNPKQPRVHQKKFSCYIFLGLVTAPLVVSRIVAVRYCLTLDEWDWLRWLSSVTISANARAPK
jgi:hypothetical protein